MSGKFITLEGGEGAGKSTHVRLLAEALTKAGLTVVTTREPGGAPEAELIRELLLKGAPERWDGIGEALLMVAARRAHLIHTIRPALARGDWVVCDRFADSTMAYQGAGAGVARETLEALHHMIAGDLMPDLTIILDLPAEEGLARTQRRTHDENRFERKNADFHRRVRDGFLDIAQRAPARCVVIGATGAIADTQQAVISAVRDRLGVALD